MRSLETIDRGQIDNALAPLVVGITGHRDLRPEDTAELSSTVKSVLDELSQKAPLTPIVMISALAEGADRLCAAVGLEHGASLIVPLPMPVEEYRRDFATEASRAEFGGLLAKAAKVLVFSDNGSDRPAAYLASTVYVVRNCDVLIALWDGVPTSGKGGTAHAVSYKLKGLPDALVPGKTALDHVERGVVVVISTPRVSNNATMGQRFGAVWTFPEDDPKEDARFEHYINDLETYNRDVSKQRHLRPTLLMGPKIALSHEAMRLEKVFRIIAGLAERFHLLRQIMLGTSASLVFLAIVAFETFDDLRAGPLWAAIYPTALFLCYLLYLFGQRLEFHRRHLDYRALAEGLRVQFFWSVAGVDNWAADAYQRQQRTELNWVRTAIRSLTLASGVGLESGGTEAQRMAFVAEAWVAYRCRRHTEVQAKTKRWLQVQDRVLISAAAISIVLSALIFIGAWRGTDPWRETAVWWMVVVPAAAAVTATFVDKFAKYEEVRRYEHMIPIYRLAYQKLAELLAEGDYEEAKKLLYELGKEALDETGSWVITNRDRELDPPEGG